MTIIFVFLEIFIDSFVLQLHMAFDISFLQISKRYLSIFSYSVT